MNFVEKYLTRMYTPILLPFIPHTRYKTIQKTE